MKLRIYRDRKKEWRWRLQSANGRIIACSGEGVTRKRDARRSANIACEAMHMLACSADMDEPWTAEGDGEVMRPVNIDWGPIEEAARANTRRLTGKDVL